MMNKKNICIFNGDMSRGGGTERITQILANGLINRSNYNIFVLNLNNSKNISYFPLDDQISFITLKENGIINKILLANGDLKLKT